MKKPLGIWKRVRRALARIPALVVVALLGITLYLTTVGFPGWLTRRVVERINRGDFALMAESMKVDLLHGLVVERARLYRKGVPGPAALDAERIVITPDLFAVASDRVGLARLKVIDGVVRPEMLIRKRASEGAGAAGAGGMRPVNAEIELESCEVQGLRVERVRGRLLIDSGAVAFREMKATVGRPGQAANGSMTGSFQYDVGTQVLTGKLETRMDPRVMVPVLRAWNMEGLITVAEWFDFPEELPDCRVDFQKLCATNTWFALKGKFQTSHCTYRRVDVMHAEGTLQVEFAENKATVMLNPLHVFRPEGQATARFTIDFERGQVDFAGTSTLDPRALNGMIGLFGESVVTNFSFGDTARIDSQGVACYRDLNRTDVHTRIEARDLGIWMLKTESCRFNVDSHGITNLITGAEGRAYGGTFSGAGALIVNTNIATNVAYRVDGVCDNVDLRLLIPALRGTNAVGREFSGNLTASIRMEGMAGSGPSVRGEGAVRIRDGLILTLPIFGGLTDVMKRIVPGLDFLVSQTEAKAKFAIANSRIKSDKITIEGDVLTLQADGTYGFDGKLDFAVQARLLKNKNLIEKGIQLLLTPISWLMEFRLVGTLERPRWYPSNFSKDLLRKIGLGGDEDDAKDGKRTSP